jgi:hypothetical protein
MAGVGQFDDRHPVAEQRVDRAGHLRRHQAELARMNAARQRSAGSRSRSGGRSANSFGSNFQLQPPSTGRTDCGSMCSRTYGRTTSCGGSVVNRARIASRLG